MISRTYELICVCVLNVHVGRCVFILTLYIAQKHIASLVDIFEFIFKIYGCRYQINLKLSKKKKKIRHLSTRDIASPQSSASSITESDS